MKLIPVTSETTHLNVCQTLLERGVVMVHFFAQAEGVVIPKHLQGQTVLRLNFSYRYGLEDLEVDERGIRASLSFRGVNHYCDIPWTCVLGLSSEVEDCIYMWYELFSVDELLNFLPPDAAEAVMRQMEKESELLRQEEGLKANPEEACCEGQEVLEDPASLLEKGANLAKQREQEADLVEEALSEPKTETREETPEPKKPRVRPKLELI